eukprot:9486974-Pyramimonas_sp.AAC.1
MRRFRCVEHRALAQEVLPGGDMLVGSVTPACSGVPDVARHVVRIHIIPVAAKPNHALGRVVVRPVDVLRCAALDVRE